MDNKFLSDSEVECFKGMGKTILLLDERGSVFISNCIVKYLVKEGDEEKFLTLFLRLCIDIGEEQASERTFRKLITDHKLPEFIIPFFANLAKHYIKNIDHEIQNTKPTEPDSGKD